MSDTPVVRRSMLRRSSRAVFAAPMAYLRSAGRALDIESIQNAWNVMRDAQRHAARPPQRPASGTRLIEKDGRFDAQATGAWMAAYARRQCEAGRVTQDVADSWETATPAELVVWAAHEVRENRGRVYLTIGKATVCGLAALLSAILVGRAGMAVMASTVLLLFFVFFVLASLRAIRTQAYLESLIRDGD